MSGGFKITSTPEWDALYLFDAQNNVQPARAIAERICDRYSIPTDSMVDEISHAIEDAREIGAKRGPLEVAAVNSLPKRD